MLLHVGSGCDRGSTDTYRLSPISLTGGLGASLYGPLELSVSGVHPLKMCTEA